MREKRAAGAGYGAPGPAPQEPPPGWVEVLIAWQNTCLAAGHSRATVRLRWTWVMRLARRHGDPRTITTAQIEAFLAWGRWSPETRRSARAAYISFFAWMHENGHTAVNVAARLPRVPVPTSTPRPAPAAVIADALPDVEPRVRLAMLLALLAGLRRAEIAALHVRDIEADRLVIFGKGSKTRTVPLHPDLAAELRPFIAEARERRDGWIFPSLRYAYGPDGETHVAIPTGRHITPATLGKRVSEALPPGFGLHSLRHSAATRWYAVDHDLFAVQQLLGHARPETTSRYVAVTSDAMRSAVMGAGGVR